MIGTLFAAVIAAVVLCQKEKTITLGVFIGSPWDVPDAYPYELIEHAIAVFEEKHPDVKVEYVSGIQKEDYSEWLSGRLLEGTAPDVFFVLAEDFSTFVNVGALSDLDSFIKREGGLWDEYYEVPYESGKINSVQYALPFESVPYMMFVNKTLLEKENIQLPDSNWDWDDFYSICQKVTKDTDGNGVIDQFGVYDYEWKFAFVTNDVDILSEGGDTCRLYSENACEAVDFMKKLDALDEGNIVKSDDFAQGKVAFMPVLLSDYRTYKPYPWSIKKYSNFDWDCITLPRGPSGDNTSFMDTLLMGINARTTKEELAWDLLLTFCNTDEVQMDIYKYSEGASALKSVTKAQTSMLLINQDSPENSGINVNLVDQLMENADSGYSFLYSDEIEHMITQEIDDILVNEKNTTISLQMLERKINQYLNK